VLCEALSATNTSVPYARRTAGGYPWRLSARRRASLMAPPELKTRMRELVLDTLSGSALDALPFFEPAAARLVAGDTLRPSRRACPTSPPGSSSRARACWASAKGSEPPAGVTCIGERLTHSKEGLERTKRPLFRGSS